jgi:endonuclease G
MTSLAARALVPIILALFVSGCSSIREPETVPPAPPANAAPAQPASAHLLLGNPSNAGTNDPNNYLIVGRGSAFSYNASRGTVNWISWTTTRQDLGDKLRRPDFQPDSRLPPGVDRITTFDYIGSGYDRGHMVPSGDRFGDRDANAETFLMTNIVPQTGALNQFPWEQLESYSRYLVRRGSDVYTIAGVYGEAGTIKGRITVPTNCWKVVVVVRQGSPVSKIDARTRVIAVDMPNIRGIENSRWEAYRTSVRDIEQKTGLDLLNALPREVQDALETRVEWRNQK